jgi:hypothetical protein
MQFIGILRLFQGIHLLFFVFFTKKAPPPGKHTLTVVDDEGNSVSVRFRVTDLS